ncbi:DUF1289 domain-containing protein [Azonexus sp.]|uniref:DUF1289 domain-containing protein n=1 Tax=Azonexus sp. TaxID=1872668 RepID=UPI0035B07A78
MSEPSEDLYPCVGICTTDPDSGYCLGCGRPPAEEPETAVPTQTPVPATGETQPPA